MAIYEDDCIFGRVLNNITAWTNDKYWAWVNGEYEAGNTTGEVVEQPQCDFPHDYDSCYYDQELDLWILTNMSTNRRPISMTAIELLEWEGDKIRFIGRLKNSGSVACTVNVSIRFCDEDGDTLRLDGTGALYYPDGYTIDKESAGWYLYSNSSGKESLWIPAGEEAIFAFGNYYSLYSTLYIGDITTPIKYIYIVVVVRQIKWCFDSYFILVYSTSVAKNRCTLLATNSVDCFLLKKFLCGNDGFC